MVSARLSGPPTNGDSSWTQVVADLATIGTRSDRADHIIAQLRDVVAADTSNAAARNDLAVALLARATLRSDAPAIFESLEQVERAVSIDSASHVAAWNHALVLELLHLDLEAATAWARYRALDTTSAWATDGATHASRLAARNHAASVTDGVAHWSGDIRGDPQGAREHVFTVLLPRWSENARGNLHTVTDSDARAIARIGEALLAHAGDSSVAHLAQLTRTTRRALLSGVAFFDTGARAFRRGEYARAQAALQEASRLLATSGGGSLLPWADVMIGFSAMYAGNYIDADRRLSQVAREAQRHGDMALRARARWGRGLSFARQGRTAEAVDEFTAASALYAQLGERTNEATMLAQGADVLFLLGRDDAAMSAKVKSLDAMSERGDARARTGAFIALGRELAETGLPAAGVAVLREAVDLAPASTRINDLPEALIRLGDAEVAAGRIAAGRANLAKAHEALTAVKDSAMYQRLEMEVNAAEATLASTDAPALALARLGTVEQYYRRGKLVFDLGRPLLQKARLELRLADTTGATRDLRAAAAAIEAHTVHSADVSAARDRAAARRDVYRELVALALAHHDTLGAFLAAEQGRGNQLAVVPDRGVGNVVLTYLVLPAETAIWTVNNGTVTLVRVPVRAARVNALADSLEGAMRSMTHAGRLDSLSRRLHALLVAPAISRLSNVHSLVIVADGRLGRIPFGALRDARGEPLIRFAALAYASATRSAEGTPDRGQEPLLIGDPAFDASLFPELAPLRSAASEVDSVARQYRHVILLAGTRATKDAIVAALPRASVVHFAGHARLVERAPSLSHLVLARSGVSLQSNTLSAEEIASMPLRGLRLAILSACGTTQGRSRRDDGESGLADAFLAAGAHGVIGSLWEVDDMAASGLMTRLHRFLAAGKEPAQALRLAQLEEAALRPIQAWGAFKYEER